MTAMGSTAEIPPLPVSSKVKLPRTRTYTRLMKRVSAVSAIGLQKVTVVGANRVGKSAVYALLSMGICTDLALIDLRKDAVDDDEATYDLLHGHTSTGRRCVIEAGSDFVITKGSKIVILTAEYEPEIAFESTHKNLDKETELEVELINKNVEMYRLFIPEILEHSPDCVIIVVSNPCDIMAWVTWKLSGLPKHRIISTGTMLDTSRFRYLIADVFKIASHSVHGFIVGAQGDSSVAVWSSVNIAGQSLMDLCPTAGSESPEEDPEMWIELFRDVIEATRAIVKLKGYPGCWSIGLMCAKLTRTILENQSTVMTVGTMPDGWNDIHDEVFLSVPCVVGQCGISHIVSMTLSEPEIKQIRTSARAMHQLINNIHI